MAIFTPLQTSSPEPSTTSTTSTAVPGPARRAQGSRLVLGPLTETTWTRPASCTVAFAGCETCNVGWQAQACIGRSSVDDDQACWPPTSQDLPKTTQALNGWGIYSPGLACPSGYTSAAESTYGNNAFQFSLTAGETAIGCCPEPNEGDSNFFVTVGAAGSQTCIQRATTGVVTLGTCQSKGFVVTATKTLPITAGQSSQQTTISAYYVYAPMFQVVHHSSDVLSFPGLATATPSVNSTATTPQPGLSAAAYAGIGISSGLAVIMIALTALFLWRRRQKAYDYHSTPTDGQDLTQSVQKEYYEGSKDVAAYHQPAVTTWGQNVAPSYYPELSGATTPSELHSQTITPVASPPVEMAAGSFYDSLEYSRPAPEGRR